MAQYLVLLYDNLDELDQWERMSPEEIERVLGKYAAWGERLEAQGKLRQQDKLRDGSGRVLRGAGASQTVTDGPFSESKEIVGGFFILEAEDYDEAVALTRDCPHLEYGGTIEIREVEPVMVDAQATA